MVKTRTAKNTITLRLEGEKISADKFRRAVVNFYALVNEVESEKIGKKKPIRWIVSVREGSIILESTPEPIDISEEEVENFVNFFGEGIETLEKSAERPEHFSNRALDLVHEISSIPDPQNIDFGRIQIFTNGKRHDITSYSKANIDSILGYKVKDFGSVEGKLETISGRKGLKFFVFDSLTDERIRCDIEKELLDEAIEAFEQRVYVYGLIAYDSAGRPKRIKVEEIKVLPKEEDLPSIDEVGGILGG